MIPSRSPLPIRRDPISHYNAVRKKAATANAACYLMLVLVTAFLPAALPVLTSTVWAKIFSGIALTGYVGYIVTLFRWSLPEARSVFLPTLREDYIRANDCSECGQPLEIDRSCSFCALNRARPLIVASGSVLPWAAALLYLLRPLVGEAVPSASVLAMQDMLTLVSALGPAVSYGIYLAAVKPGRTKRW